MATNPPTAGKSAGQIAVDWANRHTIDMARIEAAQVKNVQALLARLETSLTKEILESGVGPGKLAKLKTLQAAAGKAIGKQYGDVATQMEMTLQGVAEMEAKHQGKVLNDQIGVDVFGPVLTEKQWSAVANDTLIFGHKSGDWWASQDDSLRFRFAGEMQEGYARGESVDDLVRRLRGTKAAGYKDGIMQTSRREAEALARSSVQTISNAARIAGYETMEKDGIVKGIRWVATLDGRTTPICQALNGLEWRLPDYEPVKHAKAFPGPVAHWNCFVETTPVKSAGTVQRSYRRRYTGRLVTIKTDGGRRVTVTPNHPLLTNAGWKPAKDLQQGDQLVVQDDSPGGPLRVDPQDDQRQPTFAEFHKTFSELGSVVTVEMPIAAPDFHGDTPDDEIGEVATDRSLGGVGHTGPLKQASNFQFQRPDLEMVVLPGDGSAPERLLIADGTANRRMGRSDRRNLSARPAGMQISGPGPRDASRQTPPPQGGEADPKAGRDLPGSDLVFHVKTDRVSVVSFSEAVSVWVHNLETTTGWYFAGGIASHNCRSTQVAVMRTWEEMSGKKITALGDVELQEAVDKKLLASGMSPSKIAKARVKTQASIDGPVQASLNFQDWLKDQPDEFALDLLGPGRYGLWKEGKITTRDLTDQNNRPLTLAELNAAIDGGGFPVETEGIEYQPPAQPLPKYAGIQSETPEPFLAFTIEDVSGQPWEAMEGKVKTALQGMETDPINKMALRAALQQKAANRKAILYGPDGKIVAAIAWSDDGTSPITLWDVGSVQKGGGKAALNHIFNQAAKQGKGIKGTSLDGAEGFYKALGFDVDPNGVFTMDAAKAAKAANQGTLPPPDVANLLGDEPSYQAEAAAKIADIAANPKGQTLKAAALAKLQKDQPELPPVEMLAMAEGIAAEKQAAASKASVMSMAKKKLVAGDVPTPAQLKMLGSLTPEESAAFNQALADAQALKDADVEGIKVTVEPVKLDTKKGMAALKKAPGIEGTEWADFLDFEDDLTPFKVNQLNIVSMSPEWEAGELASLMDDTLKEQIPNQLQKFPLAKATTQQPYVHEEGIKKYLQSGKTESINQAHLGKPPMVFKLAGKYQVHDGNHRANAWKLAGETEMEALVYDLDALIAQDPKGKVVKKIFGGDVPDDILFLAKANKTPPAQPPAAGGNTASKPDYQAKNLDLEIPQPALLVKVKDLSGSTKPILAQDPGTGKQWVVKSEAGGVSPEHLVNEAAADALYRIMGAPVPGSAAVKQSGSMYKVAEFLDGAKTLGDWEKTATPAQRKAVQGEIQKHFVMDALLGNWYVAGQTNDNIMVMPDGTPVRIDNGGALDYGAQGAKKTAAQFPATTVEELETLRNPATAAGRTAEIFAAIPQTEINRQIAEITGKRKQLIEAVRATKGEAVAKTVAGRIDYLESLLPTSMRAATVETPDRPDVLASPKFDAAAKTRYGAAVPAGNRTFEDQEMMVWHEVDPTGKRMVKLQGHILKDTSDRLMADWAAAGLDVSESTTLTGQTTPTTIPGDTFYAPFVQAAKTIGAHADDGQYNQGTLQQYQNAKAQLASLPTATPEQKALKKHYTAMAKVLDEALADKKAPGKTIVAAKPLATKAATAATPAGQTITLNGVEISRVDTTEGFQYTLKELQPDGTLKDTGGMSKTGPVTRAFVARAGPVEVKVHPYRANPTNAREIQGMVRINVEGTETSSAVMDGFRTLEAIGLDAQPPTAAQRELLYLHRTIHARGDDTRPDIQAIYDSAMPEPEKIEAVKQWAEKQYKVKLPRKPEDYHRLYNPEGETASNGVGHKQYRRWDVTAKQAKTAADKSQFYHRPGNVADAVVGWMENGFRATPTRDRLRTGVPLRAGASVSEDFDKGGSGFLYTNRINKDQLSSPGVYFKGDLITRTDLQSHKGDSYGAWEYQNDPALRRHTLAELTVPTSTGVTSNTGLFKNGIGMEWLDYVRTDSQQQRTAILKRLKDQGITHLPDGRPIDDVIL